MEQDVYNSMSSKIDDLKELIELQFKYNAEQHERIEVQVTKTNGRVTTLESWKSEVIGGTKLIKFIGFTNIIVIIGYLGSLFVR